MILTPYSAAFVRRIVEDDHEGHFTSGSDVGVVAHDIDFAGQGLLKLLFTQHLELEQGYAPACELLLGYERFAFGVVECGFNANQFARLGQNRSRPCPQ